MKTCPGSFRADSFRAACEFGSREAPTPVVLTPTASAAKANVFADLDLDAA